MGERVNTDPRKQGHFSERSASPCDPRPPPARLLGRTGEQTRCGTWGHSLPHFELCLSACNTREGSKAALSEPGPPPPGPGPGRSLTLSSRTSAPRPAPACRGCCCPQIPPRWINSGEAPWAGPGLLTTTLSGLPINLQQLLKDLSPAGCRLKSPIVAKSPPCQPRTQPGTTGPGYTQQPPRLLLPGHQPSSGPAATNPMPRAAAGLLLTGTWFCARVLTREQRTDTFI